MMFGRDSLFICVTTFARSERLSGKRGSGLPSLARERISAKVWPEPVKSFSALAG